MKRFVKIVALSLVLILTFGCLYGCHKKDEVAYTIGDVEFTSGMYSCILFWCDNEARSTIYNELSEEELQEEINWSKQTIDGVKYNDYVKNRAIEEMTLYASVITEAKKANVTLDESSKQMAQTYANYYWNSYGYGPVLELNGVSFDTYVKYMEYEYLYDTYFISVYGEDGEKALSEDTLKEELKKNYALYSSISISLKGDDDEELSEDEINTLKGTADGYVTRLNGGETFAEIYEEHNKSDEDEDDTTSSKVSSENSSSETSSTEPYSEPEDEHAQLVCGLDTSSFYNKEVWEQVKDMANGTAKSYTTSDNSAVVVIVKSDILEDPYWLKNTRDIVTYSLKQEEHDGQLKTVGESLAKKENSYATGQFKPSKINYGE